jgi:hypothetical protein
VRAAESAHEEDREQKRIQMLALKPSEMTLPQVPTSPLGCLRITCQKTNVPRLPKSGLERGKRVGQDLFRAAKHYFLPAEMNSSSAPHSVDICLACATGVHKSSFLLTQYYLRSAQQGHPAKASNFGLCLEHGRGVEQSIQMGSEYYRFAADHGRPEAKFNYTHCLRLLGEWKLPERSSEVVSHPTSVDYLSEIFGHFLKKPEPLDDDGRRMLNSYDQLKAPTVIPIISTSSAVESVPNQMERGSSSVVRFSLDVKLNLSLVKTSLTPNHAELVRREASIFKTLKHSLIPRLQRDISDTREHNPAILTEFVGNRSLANHLTSSKCRLSGANRITRIILGIAFAMRSYPQEYFVGFGLECTNRRLYSQHFTGQSRHSFTFSTPSTWDLAIL